MNALYICLCLTVLRHIMFAGKDHSYSVKPALNKLSFVKMLPLYIVRHLSYTLLWRQVIISGIFQSYYLNYSTPSSAKIPQQYHLTTLSCFYTLYVYSSQYNATGKLVAQNLRSGRIYTFLCLYSLWLM